TAVAAVWSEDAVCAPVVASCCVSSVIDWFIRLKCESAFARGISECCNRALIAVSAAVEDDCGHARCFRLRGNLLADPHRPFGRVRTCRFSRVDRNDRRTCSVIDQLRVDEAVRAEDRKPRPFSSAGQASPDARSARFPLRLFLIDGCHTAILNGLLALLTDNVLSPVVDSFALVRLRRAYGADVRGVLAERLFVRARERNHALLHRSGHSFRNRKFDRMREPYTEHDARSADLRTVSHAFDLENLR